MRTIPITLAVIIAAAPTGCFTELLENQAAQPPDHVAERLDDANPMEPPRAWWDRLGAQAADGLCDWLEERGALDQEDPVDAIARTLDDRSQGLTRDHLRLIDHSCGGAPASEWRPEPPG